jgi:predicted alpha/beta hydrolase family esterase
MTTLILPGLGGSGAGHWQRWWLSQDDDATLVEQPDWEHPELETWTASLAAALEEHPGAILVAHSLGCALVAHLPARRPDLFVGGALLVAPADVDDRAWTPRSVQAFAPLPLEPLPFPSILVASSNDPYVRIARAMEFGQAWGSKLVHLRHSGHVNVESGFGAWPDGRRLAARLGTMTERTSCLPPHPIDGFRSAGHSPR